MMRGTAVLSTLVSFSLSFAFLCLLCPSHKQIYIFDGSSLPAPARFIDDPFLP
jgi:hypothetical protein